MSDITRRVRALIGVTALTAIAALSLATPASAAEGNIDPSIPRTLTIHKYELDATSPQTPGTGQPTTIPGGTPLPGAQFTVQQVLNIDLTTSAGWTEASNLTVAAAQQRPLGTAVTGTTDQNGNVSFTQLPIGVFLVTETQAPAGVTDPAAPFLVTLPYPTGATGSPSNQWIYDVNVYPKNSVTELRKTRVPAPAGSVEARNPDLVRWTIEADIPTLPSGQTPSQFVLEDTIDPAYLQFVDTPPTGVAASSVTVTNAAGAVQSFTEGSDYTIATAGSTRTVTFTTAGLQRLRTLGGGEVQYTVLTRALDVPPNGLIVNTATSRINGAIETVTGTTPIGELTILAYAQRPPQNPPLTGAVYQVFLNQNDAQTGNNPISVNGQTTFTTGADGTVNIPALTPGTYYVKEITPPAGFLLPSPNVLPTQVVPGPTSVTAPVQNYLTVPHNQVPGYLLPLTGGDGVVWFTVAGGSLIAIALGAALVAARRRRASTDAAA